ncbi:LTA synthase family protein [Paenibacillus eucommiae]|uniref:Phosphoglycerol transferase MdoB-like AlkP superfamily enzyme n=1 Tax=Paenibacillus eucommiae TaxID=1355755 RepID=A0ABS4J237_9BACL|nr:LTA synthase family protein [Paenibacillus eucommiae]MBP1993907.1 phosphoglycerol transferase MdoB-like AlkP superfamily enzyme [Paenibacillus eucommiae]
MYIIVQRFLSRIWILVLPLILMMFTEFLNRGTIGETFGWAAENPPAFFLAYLIVLALYLLLIGATGYSRISFWVLGCLLFTFAAFSGSKLKAIGAPLYPWDIFFNNQDVRYGAFFSQYFSFRIFVYIVIVAAICYILLHFSARRRQSELFKLVSLERGIYAVIAIFLLFSLVTDKPIPFKNANSIYTVPWDPTLTYDINGLVLSTMMMSDFLKTEKPENYSKKEILSILDNIPVNKQIEQNTPNKQTEPVKPNIIFVLSESFWDPTQMTNVSFSKDPIPYFRSLQKTYTSGTLLTPQFGGSSANVEFEVLTGNSMRLLPFDPDKVLPYIQYINHGIDSMASILSRQGYASMATNSFFSWFFEQRKVNKHLGFERFISSEYFPNDFSGPNYADRTIVQKVIEETEKSPGPDFIFASTMENHGPFPPGKFRDTDIEVSGPITDLSKGMLESLARGISASDDSLKALTDYFTEKGEPTILLFFGDHMPALGDDYMVYRDSGYLLEDDPDFYNKTHMTPFVIWNNYLPAAKEELHISPAYLGPYILNMAGLEGSYYTDFLQEFYKKFPVVPRPEDWAQAGISESDIAAYRKLQYDILFGKRYAYEAAGFKESIIDPDYMLGYGNPVIVKATAADTDHALTVEGRLFFPQSKVYLDGKELATSYQSGTRLTAELPEDVTLSTGKVHRLEVKLIDSKKALIGQSNVWLLP